MHTDKNRFDLIFSSSRSFFRNNSVPEFLLFYGLILLFSTAISAQNLPDAFRGYKIYKAKINVQTATDKKKSEKVDAVIEFGKIEPVDVSLLSLTFEAAPEFQTFNQSGRVDFLVFKDFRINGLNVEIAEFKEPFDFQKNKIVKLPKPVKINLSVSQAMRGALQELRDSKKFWQITGRVFVFGHFNKAGFKFKRVIPVDLNLQIENPLESGK